MEKPKPITANRMLVAQSALVHAGPSHASVEDHGRTTAAAQGATTLDPESERSRTERECTAARWLANLPCSQPFSSDQSVMLPHAYQQCRMMILSDCDVHICLQMEPAVVARPEA